MTSTHAPMRTSLAVAGAAGGVAAGARPTPTPARRRAEGAALRLRRRRDRASTRRKINDLYSRTLTPHIFEAPLHLRPPRAAGEDQAAHRRRHARSTPTTSASGRSRIRPGIFFADDPAFKGKRRELVAQDYVYSFKRFADPANKSPVWSALETRRLPRPGRAARARARRARSRSTTTREIEGMRALDRYTHPLHARASRGRASSRRWPSATCSARWRARWSSSTATEIDAHPVGTGPFRLDAVAAQLAHRARAQPRLPRDALRRRAGRRRRRGPGAAARASRAAACRWSTASRSRSSRRSSRAGCRSSTARPTSPIASATSSSPQAMPNGKVAPNLAKKGIRGYRDRRGRRATTSSSTWTIRWSAATRRHRSRCAARSPRPRHRRKIIAYAYSGLGAVGAGADAAAHHRLRPEAARPRSATTTRRAREALLDLYGFVDRDGDGWRERPDGSPLRAARLDASRRRATARSREVLNKGMKALGIRIELGHRAMAGEPEGGALRQATRCGRSAARRASPDSAAARSSATTAGRSAARTWRAFGCPRSTRSTTACQMLPDGPGAARRCSARPSGSRVAYMPYKFTLNRISLDMTQPRVIGYRRPVFWQDWWHYVDIDDGAAGAATRTALKP